MASAEREQTEPKRDDEPIYRFGAFEVNPRRRQVLRLGRPVSIQPKPFDLLVYLIRHRDRLVSRHELLAEVWRGVHVDDEALRFTLHAARKAVDDDGSRQEVIRTVPRSGFRIVAHIEEVSASSGAARGARGDADADAPRSPFVGRDPLMQEVQKLLGDAARGDSRVLLLSGEAGIGKSRALEEVGAVARGRGFRVFHGRCAESEGAPAFWPWIQILRAAVSRDPPSGLLHALGEGAREVAWMVPELRPFVRDLPQAPTVDARAARFLLLDSVTAFLRALTAEVPHVVSIDDLHRADGASALFQHVARELGQPGAPRVVLVGTYRENELRAAPALAEPIASLATLPHGRHEVLGGLGPEEVAALVRLLSGRAPGVGVIADLHRKTSGNPFFLGQILRVLESEKRLPELDSSASLTLELPRELQDAIRRRLRFLPDPARELLEIAAVIGGDFTVTELELVAELDRSAILARIGLALEAGVLGERSGDPGRYQFTHALVRDALYASLPLELRARIHAAVAKALESTSSGHASAESASIAHHYAQSVVPGDVERAAHFYELAATWSIARGAFEDAPVHLERALALLDRSRAATAPRRCRLLLQLGDALANAGQRDRARHVLRDAAEIARREGLQEEIATAALRFAPDLLAIETGVYDPELVQLLEDALESVGTASTVLRAKLLARLAVALQWNRNEEDRRRTLSEEAVQLAMQLDDPEATQYVNVLINFSLTQPERQLGSIGSCGSLSASLELLQRLVRVTALLVLGRVRDADREILDYSELVERARHPQARWYADLMRATRALMEGRHEQGEQLALRFLSLGMKHGDRNALHSYEAQRVMRAFEVGGIEVYEPRVRAMVETFPRMVAWRGGLTLVLLELGRLDEARSELYRVAEDYCSAKLPLSEWYVTAAALALTSSALGEAEIAERVYSDLLPHAAAAHPCTWRTGSRGPMSRRWRLPERCQAGFRGVARPPGPVKEFTGVADGWG
jgi:DNA-binding winged helix-turn-helix (wHTH) protein/tetratricopeptide (TPR) repeat protein